MKQVSGFSEDAAEVTSYLADTDHTSLYMVSPSFNTLVGKNKAMLIACLYVSYDLI